MLKINKFNKIIVANWKLNGSLDFIENFFHDFNKFSLNDNDICVIFCPPSVYLADVYDNLNTSFLGSQNCSIYDNGAFTGEVSAYMLSEKKCNFCIVGHSERRSIFSEKNIEIKIKIENLIKKNIHPIICIGETLEQKKLKITKDVLKSQITEAIALNIPLDSIIIAYEPIWSIGSGLTPVVQEINEIHCFIKNEISNLIDIKTIYGGSVNSKNSNEIMSLDAVDGVLVGGASLNAMEFIKIINS